MESEKLESLRVEIASLVTKYSEENTNQPLLLEVKL